MFQTYSGARADWMAAAFAELGAEFAQKLSSDLSLFQDQGRELISEADRVNLISAYSSFAHPAAAEIVRWLKGDYQVSRELVLTQ